MAPRMYIQQSRFALFCRVSLEDKLTLAAELRNRNRGRFDGEPLLLPTPPTSLPDLPGIVLRSKDGNSSLTVSSVRVDIETRYEGSQFESIPALIESDRDFLTGLADTISKSEQVDGNIERFGIMLFLSTNVDNETLGRVRAEFLNSSISLGQHRTEIGFLDRQSWKGFEVNRWIRLMTAQLPGSSGLLEVALDVNTIPEIDYNMSEESLGRFLEELKARVVGEMEVFDV